MKRTNRRTSKRASSPDGLKRWAADLSIFREQVGFDLAEPVGFSEYLLAVYGKGVPEEVGRLFDPSVAAEDYGFDAGGYRKMFSAWAKAMAPDGITCARGLHSLGFLPKDDIAKIVFGHGDRSSSDNYSMNLAYAAFQFATRPVSDLYPSVSALWARSAAVIEPAAAEAVGVQVRGDVDRYRDASRAKKGLPPMLYWRSMPKKVRDAISISQCPVVIVSRVGVESMNGWGGDSESGDTMEAELHVKHCEPRCVERFFVASAVHKLGKLVRADERRLFALDEHVVVKGRPVYGDPVSLILHPDTPVKGRVIRNLPDEWKWYEVEVNP